MHILLAPVKFVQVALSRSWTLTDTTPSLLTVTSILSACIPLSSSLFSFDYIVLLAPYNVTPGPSFPSVLLFLVVFCCHGLHVRMVLYIVPAALQ